MNQLAATDVALGNRYRLLSPLGAGGMAEVYEGWDDRLARPVAIKLLRPDLACHPDLRRRFEFEAKAAARLSHPNVVSVYDAGEEDGRSYIVMERLRGESLADVIRRGPMDQAWLRRIAEEVLGALAAAHAAGIVHRDVKPANILLGSDGCAKVADFGIASVTQEQLGADDDSPTACHTGVGLVIGTIAYMAPERAMGQPATVQSDLYSLGVVLYEALTGVKPFAGGTAVEIADAALKRQARNPAVLRPDADPQLVAVIGRAMNPDPAHRYPTDAAMAADLRSPGPEPTAVFNSAAVGALSAAPPAGGSSWVGESPVAGSSVGAAAAESALAADLSPMPATAGSPDPAALFDDADVDGLALLQAPEAGGDAHRAATVLTPQARQRRKQAAVVAVAAVAAVVLVLTMVHPNPTSQASPTTTTAPARAAATTPSTTPPSTTPNLLATDATSEALDAIARQVASSGSAAAGQLASGLQQVATIADATARATAATNLFNQAGQWLQRGELTYSTYVAAVSVLQQAGATGSILAPSPSPSPSPSTAPSPSSGQQAKHHSGGKKD
ncbi:MAG: serine/threonine-protein kinase [Acidimicrobiales bacterium]